MVLIIIIAVLLIFICGQIYLKKLRKEAEKNASEISSAEGENFEVEQIVKTYRNEEQYQKKRSRLYLQMIFFAGVLTVFGFGWYLYQEYREALSLEKMKSVVPEWRNVKDHYPNLFVPSEETQNDMFAEYQKMRIAKLKENIKDYCCDYHRQENISELNEFEKMTASEYWNSDAKSVGYFGCWSLLTLSLGLLIGYLFLRCVGLKVLFGLLSLLFYLLLPMIPDFYSITEKNLFWCYGCIWLFCIIYFGQKKYRCDC